jgi:hypothetical protein
MSGIAMLMTPPTPYDGATSPFECRAVRGTLSISELELVGVVGRERP